MTLRRDHVAAAALIILGVVVLVLGHELPFGTPASPGPGMLPTLVTGVMMALALVLLVQAGSSPPLTTIAWDDIGHGAIVLTTAIAAAALYTTLGFLTTIGLMLFMLMVVVERMRLLTSVVITVLVTGGTYGLLSTLLKSPMPTGIFGF